MRLSEVAPVLGGRLVGEDADFTSVGTDTRQNLRGALYVALRGARFDGHDFVSQAQAAGAVAALVSRPQAVDLPQLQVDDTRLALGRLARHWRRQRFQGRLIGVTGSNGKTTVKEMIAAALGGPPAVLKTGGNLNNDIGVPLTLLRLTPAQRWAVVEMGANHPGEIAYVAGLAEPEIGVVTQAAPAHLAGFGSLEGVARAKGELVAALPPEGTAVLNADDPFFDHWRCQSRARRILSFGFGDADVRAVEVAPLAFSDGRFHNRFEVEALGQRFSLDLALAGRHNVANALAAVAAALAAGGDLQTIRAGLEGLRPVPGRLRPLPAQGGAWLLDDCYNANPASFAAGLDTLSALGGEPWVILGAFGELGPESARWHRQAGALARRHRVAYLLAVGEDAKAAVASFGGGGQWFSSREALIRAARKHLHGGARILVKGSRSQGLEHVVRALEAA